MGAVCSGEEQAKAEKDQEPQTITTSDDKPEEKPADDKAAEPKDGPCIKIVGCRGLRNADWSWIPGKGLSDAYVLAKIAGKEVLRTKVVPNALEPLFNEEFELKGDFGATPEKIEFEVYDKDVTTDDFLGKATIEKDQLEKGFNGEIALQDAGKGIKAFLKLMIKRPGSKDYPAGPTGEFNITIKKAKGTPIGFEVDLADPNALFITQGFEGAAKEHNDKTEDPTLQLKKMQYIVQVNKVKGDAAKMDKELKDAAEVTLTIRRPMVFTIAMKKEGKLGLVLTAAPTSAYISKISDAKDTAIKAWNSAHKDKEVKAGDRCVQVNDKMGTGQELIDMMSKDGNQQTLICRPADVSVAAAVSSWFW